MAKEKKPTGGAIPTFGKKFEKQFDLVDVVWCQFWPGDGADEDADGDEDAIGAVDIWFLVARSGLHEFSEFMDKYQRGKIIQKKRRGKDWSPFEHSLIDGPLAERQDEGICRFILHGVCGADSEMQFDPLGGEENSHFVGTENTHAEGDFRACVKAMLDSQRREGEVPFRRITMKFSDDEERFRRDQLEEEAKNYAKRFAGSSQ